ncbi:MAG TPA: heparan-alpha-glucosaminide N-acetyltransferase domain-containing protein [Gemmatimonadaceae bacterium]|nr:heparan-alpha-glucosaminide N-acetyltransferase domain-containing protein [Gemmatimonadaceae bacterium]
MDATTTRIKSLDVMRGAVMVLMAIDHVRVYSGLPAGGPTPGIFFTRWITHFVAPAFCFLAGTGAFLHGRKLGDKGALARYLATRGLVLVLLELTVIREAWTFNFDYAHYILAGVIWMLGWCMILLSLLVRWRTKAIAAFGMVVIAAQNLIGVVGSKMPESAGWIFQFLYFGGPVQLGQNGPTIGVLYSIVPWIGVMAVGYAFGEIMIRESAERRRLCLRIGLSATALFLVIGGIIVLMHPPRPNAPPALFRLLGQQKYPASQLFLLMTLGPVIALLPLAERARGWLGEMLATFGRVPFFYYLLHIPTIHVAAIIVSLLREGSVNPWLFGNHPWSPPPLPEGYRWGLPLLYLVFVIVIAVLYVPCRWFARVKARGGPGWLRYI